MVMKPHAAETQADQMTGQLAGMTVLLTSCSIWCGIWAYQVVTQHRLLLWKQGAMQGPHYGLHCNLFDCFLVKAS